MNLRKILFFVPFVVLVIGFMALGYTWYSLYAENKSDLDNSLVDNISAAGRRDCSGLGNGNREDTFCQDVITAEVAANYLPPGVTVSEPIDGIYKEAEVSLTGVGLVERCLNPLALFPQAYKKNDPDLAEPDDYDLSQTVLVDPQNDTQKESASIFNPKIHIRKSGSQDRESGKLYLETLNSAIPILQNTDIIAGGQTYDFNYLADSIQFFTVDERSDDALGCLFNDRFTYSIRARNNSVVDKSIAKGRCCPQGYLSTQYGTPFTTRVCCNIADLPVQAQGGVINLQQIPTASIDRVALSILKTDLEATAQIYTGNQFDPWKKWLSRFQEGGVLGGTESLTDNRQGFLTPRYGNWDRFEPESIRKVVDTSDNNSRCFVNTDAGAIQERPAVGDYGLMNLEAFMVPEQYTLCEPTPTPIYSGTILGCLQFLGQEQQLTEENIAAIEAESDRIWGNNPVTIDQTQLAAIGDLEALSPQEQEQALTAAFGDFKKVVVPSDIRNTLFKMCDACAPLSSNSPTLEEQSAVNSCLLCERTPDAVWTDLGCIEATDTGIANWINRIFIGISGFLIIARMSQIIIILITKSGDSNAQGEVREIAISLVSFLILVGGGYILVRVIAYNLLDIGVPVF